MKSRVKKSAGRLAWRICPGFMLERQGFRRTDAATLRDFLDLFLEARSEGRILMSLPEIFHLHRLAAATVSVPGETAEVGVFKGGSAKIIAAAQGSRSLYLFDTFSGMPREDRAFDPDRSGGFAGTSIESVAAYLGDSPSIVFRPGAFPESAGSLPPDLRFSFVHLDADLYLSTRAGLEYFYPRLSPGGVILAHDYGAPKCPGVRKAWDEFFAEKPVTPIFLPPRQVYVRKRE
jgi:hypothetical protein